MASRIPIESQQFSNKTIWSIYDTLTDITNPGLSGPESNGNEVVTSLFSEHRI